MNKTLSAILLFIAFAYPLSPRVVLAICGAGDTYSEIFPAASVGGDSFDGRIERIATESFATIRAGAGNGISNVVTATGVYAGQNGTAFTELMRNQMTFPTGLTISAGATISEATTSFNGGNNQIGDNTTVNPAITLASSSSRVYNQGFNEDYESMTVTNTATEIYSDTQIRVVNWSTANAYGNVFLLNTNGLNNITTGGTGASAVTKQSFQFSFDASNTAPTLVATDYYAYAYTADQTGTAQDPRLGVCWQAAAAGGAVSPTQDIIWFD